MNERDFTTAFLRGCRSVGFHGVRIPDAGKADRFTTVKPYDLVIATPPGRYHAVELKLVTKGASWPIRALQPHQEAALLDAERVGAPGWVIVGWNVRLSERERERQGRDVVSGAWAARIRQVVQARVEDARTNLPLPWFVQNAIELPRLALRGEDGSRLAAYDPRPLVACVETGAPALPPPSSPGSAAPPGPSPEPKDPTPPARAESPSLPPSRPKPSRCDRSLSLFRPLSESA